MNIRANLIQTLINKFWYDMYLEIGCSDDVTFDQIRCKKKIGIDPVKGGTVRKTSDEYFASLSSDFKFDVVFVDGLHERRQAFRDILNSLAHLESGGVVVVHDCLPKIEDHQLSVQEFEKKFGEFPPGICTSRSWNGDVWKTIAELKSFPLLDLCVLDQDWGLAVIKDRSNQTIIPSTNSSRLEWKDFEDLKLQFSLVQSIEQVITFMEEP